LYRGTRGVRWTDWFGLRSRAAKPVIGHVVAGALLLSSGCSSPMSALDPRGPQAATIADLWWLMFWLATAVFVVVMGFLLYSIVLARRRSNRAEVPLGETPFILISGAAVPAVIIIVLLVSSIRTGSAIYAPPVTGTFAIEVIGHQFWWEVRYPDHQVTTANEIHIPVGQPVELRLTSADVIHSFWVPNLAGKLDLNPGVTNITWIQADEPNVYRGVCAEFCGVQHALMHFLVVAEPSEQFEAWVERRRQVPPAISADPLLERGLRVYFDAGCALCHIVRGTVEPTATGVVGPELTHFGGQRTIGAAIVDNTDENLARWILNPHDIKPGVRMPATPLSADDLQALVAYLRSLE
jgi:cytochrome c oxidase subunit II